jgi:Txe/YoeB family toxin of Txe-Axe toxin-antitoxin module
MLPAVRNDDLKDVQRDTFQGVGEPEPLRRDFGRHQEKLVGLRFIA